MKLRFSYIVLTLLFLSGCGGRKGEFRSGIFDYQERSIAWYTNKHEIGYVLSFPKATSVSDNLVTTKKSIALVQEVTIGVNKYSITSVNELKDGISRIYINGKRYETTDETYITENAGAFTVEVKLPEDIRTQVLTASRNSEYPMPEDPLFWLVLGFLAQALFTSRMLVQWYASEKAKKSVVPVLFWYLSLSGSSLLFAYAVYRQDPVFILGQGSGLIVYIRNLVLIKSHKTKSTSDQNNVEPQNATN